MSSETFQKCPKFTCAWRLPIADGWLLMLGAVVCSTITAYRLTIAFRRYLRVHLPFATALASQVITLLTVFLALVPIADFSRQLW